MPGIYPEERIQISAVIDQFYALNDTIHLDETKHYTKREHIIHYCHVTNFMNKSQTWLFSTQILTVIPKLYMS